MGGQLPMPAPGLDRLERAYEAWRAANPEAFTLFLRYARQAQRRGRRFGIALLTERVRWEAQMTWSKDAQGFKLNNNYRAYIARDLIARLPGLARLIETRTTRGERRRREEVRAA